MESIIRRGNGVVDPDAPDDPESVAFWVTRKAKFNDRVKVKQSQHLHLSGRATEGFINDVTSEVGPTTVAGAATSPTDTLLALSKNLANTAPAPEGGGPYKFRICCVPNLLVNVKML